MKILLWFPKQNAVEHKPLFTAVSNNRSTVHVLLKKKSKCLNVTHKVRLTIKLLLVLVSAQGFEIQQVGLVVDLVELQRHLGELAGDGIAFANAQVKRIDRLPLKI